MTKDYNNRIKLVTPINILDNSDFRNPVNQRNVVNWNYIGYGIDRWTTMGNNNPDITVTASGLEVNQADYIVQIFEAIKLVGVSKVTAAINVDGVIYTGTLDISDWSVGTDLPIIGYDVIPGILVTGLQWESQNLFRIYLATLSNVLISWFALYVGEYTIETLPEYHPKEYSIELAECQRYYRDIYLRGSVGFLHGDNAWFNLSFIKMRLPIPTVQVINGDNLVTKEGYFPVLSDGAYFDATNNVVLKVSNSLNLPNFYPVGAFFGHIALSADL